ncbi:MAG: TonB-dependent receptor [Cytophagales bacterium]|jgi:TonB-linked SusC/RagA family outer membrane protein|nr:TonB-dependent receptor [Cytophagales bacterium]MCA6388949.1 TonB-dependent receptor [Cytophagales bacterium]MCA6391367.1 TonB-dependent receptor [Cytophagales bacterium]MCA6395363.1 TonB-dependent receptor [Cytophagales bacterium]MCA6398418.1 TonB-dependent receptor [Cytophagales bacterium]
MQKDLLKKALPKLKPTLCWILIQVAVATMALAGSLQQDTKKVTGKVTDSNEKAGLPGVNIIIKGTSSGTVTDSDGNYAMNIPNENTILVFSFIGYASTEVAVSGRSVVDVSLESDTQALQEVIVTGYAAQRSQDITGAIATVSMKNEPIMPVANIGQALQGKLAGVRVTQPSGRPGQGMTFQIRGAASLTAGADPLYVVDGMPITGDLGFINPNEIENITVLKDPAAASVYGSRASNGVVLINTKSGKPGKVQVDFNSYVGVEDVPQSRRLDMMDATEYAQFQKEIATTNGRPVNPVFQNPTQYGKGTDWFNELTRSGVIQSYNVSLSSGTDKFKTSVTAGYFNQEGVIVGTSFNRFSVRLNTRYQATEKLSIGFNVAPTSTFNTNFNTDGWPYATENIISSALLTTPLASPYNPDGTLALTASDPATFGNPNWLRVAKNKVFEDKDFRLLSNAYLEYEIISGLTAKATINVQTGNRNIFQFNPSTNGVLFIPPPRVPSGSNSDSRFINWVNENTLSYQKKIGNDHAIDALIGFTSQKFRSDATTASGTNFPDDKIQTVNAARNVLVSSDIQEWSLLSQLARLNYTYKDKYLFSASIRRDGSSRFGPNNRYGSFPAVSAGWVISKESFWNFAPISFLKLRASYGITGNFNIGNYTHISSISTSFYPFGNSVSSGRGANNLGDQNLGWENNKQFNIGADFNLFKDRVQVTYNYYTRNSTELLYNVPVPVSSGFSNIQTNIGELKFWGHEIGVNAEVLQRRKLKWNTNFNISFDRNRTEALATQNGFLPSGIRLYIFDSHRTQVGQPIAQFYGAVHNGVYRDQADFNASPKDPSSVVGSVKFRDLNGDGKISFPEDMTFIGNPWPKFTFGWTNNLTYGNFNLSVTMAGSYGNQILAFHENWTTNLDGVFNVLDEVKNRWKSEAEPGDGKYGTVQAGSTFLERDRWNSRFIKDGSYLAFKNITLGYSIPLGGKGLLTRAQVYTSIQNAFIITSYKGPNPEVNTQTNGATAANQTSFGLTPGVDENSYPIPRTISVGVNISF